MYIIKLTFLSHQNIDSQNIKYKIIKAKKKFKKKIKIVKIFSLKRKKKIYTILKSPHVNKKAREHFKYEIFKKHFYLKSTEIFLIFNFLILIF